MLSNDSRAGRRPLAAVLALITAALAAPAGAAARATAGAGFRTPTLVDGLLSVKGTKGADAIDIHLRVGQPDTLVVDVGNGAIDFNFPTAVVSRIAVDAGAGDDTVVLD